VYSVIYALEAAPIAIHDSSHRVQSLSVM